MWETLPEEVTLIEIKKLESIFLTAIAVLSVVLSILTILSATHFVAKEADVPEVKTITITETIAVPTPVPAEKNYVHVGTFKTTGYCPCKECSEGYGKSTATGATATEGITIAVDPNVIPYGTKVWINGHVYIAQDCGGAVKGNHIDIYVENHEDCDKMNGSYEIYIEKTEE